MKFSAELLPESNSLILYGVYEISDVCDGKVHAFHNNILTHQARCNTEDNDGGWTAYTEKKNWCLSTSQFHTYMGRVCTRIWRSEHWILVWALQHPLPHHRRASWTSTFRNINQWNFTPLDLSPVCCRSIKGQIYSFLVLRSPFTTYDNDNHVWSLNCALYRLQGNGGEWWYSGCSHIFLTHPHPSIHYPQQDHVSFMEMKVCPKQCISWTELNGQKNLHILMSAAVSMHVDWNQIVHIFPVTSGPSEPSSYCSTDFLYI